MDPRKHATSLAAALALVGLGTGTTVAAIPMSTSTALPNFVDVAGAHIVSQVQLTARTVALTISSPSFSTNTIVEITLPTGYEIDAARRWPTTYYLAGTNHDETTFRADYDGENLTSSYPSIVVSPDGQSGYWSDWFNVGLGGAPTYETFVVSQLIPLIDANFRTMANRANRAIMGESMGGYGATMMAARHPDLFVAASSLSGAVDAHYLPGTLITTVSPALMLALPDSIHGPRSEQEVRWRGLNPADIAANLRDIQLQVRSGSGVLSASNGETLPDQAGCPLEWGVIKPESVALHNVLNALEVRHEYQQYDWGCHSVALFEHEIRDTLPGFVRAFGASAPARRQQPGADNRRLWLDRNYHAADLRSSSTGRRRHRWRRDHLDRFCVRPNQIQGGSWNRGRPPAVPDRQRPSPDQRERDLPERLTGWSRELPRRTNATFNMGIEGLVARTALPVPRSMCQPARCKEKTTPMECRLPTGMQ